MHPKLKPDAYWVPHADGVTFVHVSGYLNVNGRSAMPLMNRLAPYLDGSNSLDDLVDGLDDGKRTMVTTLVNALAEAGLLKDVTDDRPHGLTPAELERYSGEIAYIDYYLDSAAARFERYRTTPILCVGAGLTLAALVHSCLTTGVRQLAVAITDECATDVDRVGEYMAEAVERDPLLRPRMLDPLAGDGSDLVATLRSSGAEVLLHVSDRPMLDRALQLDRLCRAEDVVLVQGVVVDDEAWTGPVVGSKHHPSAGWESVWARRSATRSGPVTETAAAPSEFLAGPTASIVANRIGFAAFRELTGIAEVDHPAGHFDGDRRDRLTVMNLETLQTVEHRAYPHPATAPAAATTDAELVERMAAFRAAEKLPDAEFSQLSASAFDPRTGLLRELAEDEQTQLPLCVSVAQVSDPFGVLDTADGLPEVTGHGDDMVAARYDAAIGGLVTYAALAVDRRRLLDGTVAAFDLVHDRPARLAAERVHPVLAHGGPASAWQRPTGLHAGADAAESLQLGLAEHVVALTLDELRTDPAALAEIGVLDDPAFAAAGEQAARYRELLRIARADVDVHRVVGSLGLAVYVGRHGDHVVGSSTHPVDVLAALLLVGQGRVTPSEPLPAALRAATAAPPGAPGALPPWTELVERLQAAGHTAYAVPGCHDPIIDTILPTLVRVVLGD
ncbi:hypothetical protein WEH80_10795 [Actinomycetes bacterium KLBMP 9759]